MERTSIIADNPDGIRRKIKPLLRVECEIPRFLKPIQSIDVTTDKNFEHRYPKICKDLGGTMRSSRLPSDRDKLPPVVQLPKPNHMPYRSLGQSFAGRIKELWQLHDFLCQDNTAVIEGVGVVMGTGGLGKTQLAIEYVHRFAGYYPGGVFWADADKGQELAISQINQGYEQQVDGALPAEHQWIQLIQLLNKSAGPKLIVFDNFPENKALEPWLPVGNNIQTLITTRRKDLRHNKKLTLPFLNEEEGLSLLNSRERSFGQEAVPLVNSLGGLPLALELACNFLNCRPNLGIEELLQEIHTLGEIQTLTLFTEDYRDELPTGHEKAVTATFQLSWELASEEAQKILKFMALWAPAPVPRRLLRRAYPTTSESLLTDRLEIAISDLVRLSLVELDEDHDPQTHRLIAGFIKSKINEEDPLVEQAINSVNSELARTTDEYDTASLTELEKILVHGGAILDSGLATNVIASNIADYIRWHHKTQGRFQLAKQFGERALSIDQQNFEPGHPSIAIRQSNLATVLKDLGELPAAKQLLTEAFASAQQGFEPGHPSIAISQSNLALVLKDLGELPAAKQLLTEALASDQQNFGTRTPFHCNTSIESCLGA